MCCPAISLAFSILHFSFSILLNLSGILNPSLSFRSRCARARAAPSPHTPFAAFLSKRIRSHGCGQGAHSPPCRSPLQFWPGPALINLDSYPRSFSGDGAWDAVAEEVLSILDALNRSGQLRPGRSRDRFEKLCGDGIMYKLSIDAMLGSGDDDEGRGRGVVERLVERAPELRGLDEGRLYVDVFDREAHLAILDTLAHIRISSLASIADLHESSTRACISCSAQTPPYPSDLEDALASWLSSRCLAAIMDMDGSDMGPHAALASRLGFASGSPTFDDLQFDISDGRGLLLLLSHHSPRAIACGSTASGVCKTLGDKMSNCRAVIAACDALGLSLLLSPDDLVQVDPGMRVLVNLFLSSIFMRVERPAAYSRLTNTAKYAESVQALPGMAPSDSQGEGTVLGQTAGGSKVMLEILNVDRHAKQHQQQQQQQKPVGAASRRRKPSEHGPEVLIIEHSPATSPTDARDDGTGNRNDNSNYLHSSPSSRSVAPLGKNKSSADGIGFLSSTPARVLNKSSLEGIGYLGSPHTPHANLLGKSSLVARSPTPRIAPSPAEGSPKPKLSPAAVAATGLGGGKYFDGRLSDGEGDWGVVPAVILPTKSLLVFSPLDLFFFPSQACSSLLLSHLSPCFLLSFIPSCHLSTLAAFIFSSPVLIHLSFSLFFKRLREHTI